MNLVNETTTNTEQTVLTLAEECCSSETSSCCQDGSCGSNTMQTAMALSLGELRSLCICCPEGEYWYRFTPAESGSHTLRISGFTGLRGTVYQANGQVVNNVFEALEYSECDGLFQSILPLNANQTYYLKVETDGTAEGCCYLTVAKTKWLSSIEILALTSAGKDAGQTLIVGQEQIYLKAVLKPSCTTNRLYRWSSSNPSVATVDSCYGIVRPKAPGEVTFTVTAQDGSGVTASYHFTVRELVKVSSIAVSPTAMTMNVGNTYAGLSVTISPSNADDKTIQWTSDDSTIAEVDPVTGCITAKSPGTTTIYATAQDGSGVSGYCQCTICFDNMLIYRTRNRERLGFYDSSDNTDITPITAEDLTYGEKDTQTMISNGTRIALSDLNGYTSISKRVTIIKNFFNSQINYDKKFMEILSEMVDHFVDGTGTDYSNSELTTAVQAHPRTISYVNAVIEIIKDYISQNRENINNLTYDESLWTQPFQRVLHPLVQSMNLKISNGAVELYLPSYGYNNGVPGLTLALDGFYGNKISLKSFQSSEEEYSGIVEFTFYDHFGLDTPDLTNIKFGNLTAGTLPGFKQWYILQHWSELEGTIQPKPFVTNVSFSIPISGTYA